MSVRSSLRADVFRAPRGGVLVFGTNPAVGTSAEALWPYGGGYNFTIGSGSVKVASSSASDTSAGSGARTVRVYGLVSGVLTSEDAILNGTTAVALTSVFTRIYAIEVLTAGVGEVNAGDLYVFTGASSGGVPSTSTEVYAKVVAGASSAWGAAFQVPLRYTASVIGLTASCGDTTNSVRVQLMVRRSGVRREVFATTILGQCIDLTFNVPIPLEPGDDVYLQATASGGTPEVLGCFEVVLL